MTKDQFITWAISQGYTLDRWSHLQRVSLETPKHSTSIDPSQTPEPTQVHRRYKLSKIMVRREVKVGAAGWVRVMSGYYKDLSISPEGKLVGMKR